MALVVSPQQRQEAEQQQARGRAGSRKGEGSDNVDLAAQNLIDQYGADEISLKLQERLAVQAGIQVGHAGIGNLLAASFLPQSTGLPTQLPDYPFVPAEIEFPLDKIVEMRNKAMEHVANTEVKIVWDSLPRE